MADDPGILETLRVRLAAETAAKRGALRRAEAAEKRAAAMLVDRAKALRAIDAIRESCAHVGKAGSRSVETKQYDDLAMMFLDHSLVLAKQGIVLADLFQEKAMKR